jgi:hypothetical protein
MYEVYRVRRMFGWDGWQYSRRGACGCGCSNCTGENGTGCKVCGGSICHCEGGCYIPAERFAGDVWLVPAGHPRKEIMLAQRLVVPDASIPAPKTDKNGDFTEPHYQRLLQPPRALAGAARG